MRITLGFMMEITNALIIITSIIDTFPSFNANSAWNYYGFSGRVYLIYFCFTNDSVLRYNANVAWYYDIRQGFVDHHYFYHRYGSVMRELRKLVGIFQQ